MKLRKPHQLLGKIILFSILGIIFLSNLIVKLRIKYALLTIPIVPTMMKLGVKVENNCAKTIWLTPAKIIIDNKYVWIFVNPTSIPKIPYAIPKGKLLIVRGFLASNHF